MSFASFLPGRFRSLGDGTVDFSGIFSKLSQYGFDGWAVLEWECCIKSSKQGAQEGAEFISNHIINVTEKAFDDFAGGEANDKINKKGLEYEQNAFLTSEIDYLDKK